MSRYDPFTLTWRKPGYACLTPDAADQEKAFEAGTLRLPHWMSDSQRFSYVDRLPEGDGMTLWTYDIRSGERKQIIPRKALMLPKGEPMPAGDDSDEDDAVHSDPTMLRIRGYQWSSDETQILFARNPSAHAAIPGDTSLFVYTLESGRMERVASHKLPHRNVKWSPDGKRIGYVRGDELYVLDVVTHTEMRLTTSATTTIFNGRFGWLYEEELELLDGWEWSPDSKYIVYYQYDETAVPIVGIPDYDDLHIKPRLTRYPRPGDPNPTVRIGLLEIPEVLPKPPHGVPTTRWVELGNAENYVVSIQWMPSGALLVHRMPRLQNRLDLLKVDPATGKGTGLLTEEDKAWIDAWESSFDRGGSYKLTAQFVKGTGEFLWLSDRDGFRHLYLYDANGKLLRQLTKGSWDVEGLAGLDSTHRIAFFTAARPTPLERQLFSVLLDGGGEVMQVSEGAGTHRPLFAPDTQHFLDHYSSHVRQPHIRLYRASGRKVADVREIVPQRQEEARSGEWEFGTFKTSDGVNLYYGMLKPADFDPKRKYPVLMYTYGGPGFQVVLDDWGGGSGLEPYCQQHGVISVMVDGRGSGMRGRDFLKAVYRNLGKWEVHDQIEAAKWLGTLPYVDPQRIGIWGASYGGYMACLCLLRGADVFKMAMALAPVAHWTLYDTIYTERYMRLPKDNPEGYESSSPILEAGKLKGALLLIHGTADDNVHFQNTARLVSALQKHEKTFQTMFYPGEDHSLSGTGRHLEMTLTRFIKENL